MDTSKYRLCENCIEGTCGHPAGKRFTITTNVINTTCQLHVDTTRLRNQNGDEFVIYHIPIPTRKFEVPNHNFSAPGRVYNPNNRRQVRTDGYRNQRRDRDVNDTRWRNQKFPNDVNNQRDDDNNSQREKWPAKSDGNNNHESDRNSESDNDEPQHQSRSQSRS